jgi:ABC-type antimicrobial peptide transport system permease subunit
VIEDVSNINLASTNEYDLYVPFLRTATVFDRLDLTVRYRGNTDRVATAVRETIWDIDPDLPVGTMLTMDERRARSMNAPRFYSTLFAVFASVAFLLAGSGIYASMTYVVGQRRRELGIRVAIGGTPNSVLRMVMRRGMGVTTVGLLLGLGGAWALSRLLESLLFGIRATDPITFLSVSLMLGVISMFACYIPSRRAASADPLEVLKAD